MESRGHRKKICKATYLTPRSYRSYQIPHLMLSLGQLDKMLYEAWLVYDSQLCDFRTLFKLLNVNMSSHLLEQHRK